MRINHNIAALNTYRQLGSANNAQQSSMEKLSSGLRINNASDDAAGLAISEKMRGQIRGLDMATRNAQDGVSLLQTAEGALNETHSILQRMNELATQGANETLSTNDRDAIGDELTQLNDELNRISDATKFNGEKLLDGNFGAQLGSSGLAVGSDGVTSIDVSGAEGNTTFTIAAHGSVANGIELSDGSGNTQTVVLADNTAGTLNFDKLGVKITVNDSFTASGLGSAVAGGGNVGEIVTDTNNTKHIQIGSEDDVNQRLGISIAAADATSLGVNNISVSTAVDARSAMSDIQTAIDDVSRERSKIGAFQNRLEHTINNLGTTSENLTAAESRIRDVDMAKEMMNQTKNSILAQASQAMLAQANQQPQGVLQLLR
ncbi:flagellin [Halobacillus litoralis]|uniref:flagellin N-terminal helical domain-containing protein n=1 Tax=Halobacillus litoralis TaxID=45668 RepID=UPI001CD2B2E7|nr:flagellin [Halobacillus litoralis]MCA1021261.1 flagellin [Halobacillus litoralis]